MAGSTMLHCYEVTEDAFMNWSFWRFTGLKILWQHCQEEMCFINMLLQLSFYSLSSHASSQSVLSHPIHGVGPGADSVGITVLTAPLYISYANFSLGGSQWGPAALILQLRSCCFRIQIVKPNSFVCSFGYVLEPYLKAAFTFIEIIHALSFTSPECKGT